MRNRVINRNLLAFFLAVFAHSIKMLVKNTNSSIRSYLNTKFFTSKKSIVLWNVLLNHVFQAALSVYRSELEYNIGPLLAHKSWCMKAACSMKGFDVNWCFGSIFCLVFAYNCFEQLLIGKQNTIKYLAACDF